MLLLYFFNVSLNFLLMRMSNITSFTAEWHVAGCKAEA